MNTIATETMPDLMPDAIVRAEQTHAPSLDRTLNEIRSGRRLEKIAASIECFLHSQIVRLDKAIDECNRSVENDKIVQRIFADFEIEKQTWEEKRQDEILRLSAAGDELIRGWEKLEAERQKWLEQRED